MTIHFEHPRRLTAMPSLFCTGCRRETHTDHLRADADGYYWCEECRPALWLPAKAAVRRVAPRKATARTNGPPPSEMAPTGPGTETPPGAGGR